MSYLLEILGRGRVAEMSKLFAGFFSAVTDDDLAQIRVESAENPDDPQRHARLALAALQRYRLADAEAGFRQAVRLQPDLLIARLGLACCYEQQDRIGLAIEQLKLANTVAPGEQSLLLALAYCTERAGRADEAAAIYRDILTRPSAPLSARERLAAIDLAAGRVEGAIEQYEELRADCGGGDPHVRLCLGNLYLKAGRAADAAEEFAAAIALAPENWSARHQLVDALVGQGRLADAVDQLTELLAAEPDCGDLHVQLADIYVAMAQDELAVRHFARALELDGDCLEASVKLATQHLRSGRFADASIAFNRAVQISDRAITAYVGLAVAQKNAGQWAESADTLELAAQISPNSTLLFREMARLELKAGLARQGESAFTAQAAGESAPSTSADAVEDWNQLLDFQIDRHRQAVVDRPNHADLHYRLGLLLTGQDDLAGAIEQFAQAVRINPGYTKARIKLGLALRQAGQTDRAIEELSAALDLNPQYADVQYRLGLMFVEQQRLGEAADCFTRSLSINWSNAEVRANLATCLESMGLLDRASEQWRLLAEGSDTSPETTLARRRLANIPKK